LEMRSSAYIYIYLFFPCFSGIFWFEFACPSLLGHSPGDTTRTVCLNLLVSQTCSVLWVDIGGNIFYIIPKQRNMSNFLGSETSQMRHAHHWYTNELGYRFLFFLQSCRINSARLNLLVPFPNLFLKLFASGIVAMTASRFLDSKWFITSALIYVWSILLIDLDCSLYDLYWFVMKYVDY
jgi:hypothetical protein